VYGVAGDIDGVEAQTSVASIGITVDSILVLLKPQAASCPHATYTAPDLISEADVFWKRSRLSWIQETCDSWLRCYVYLHLHDMY
jgi:hypothetical protein